MKALEINGKKLPVPSFFQIFNFGGGVADKSREIVYADMTYNTPALINYYYINNKYPHNFSSPYFNNATELFDRVGNLYNYIRIQLIEKGNVYIKYDIPNFDFNDKIMMLDSGSFNIVKFVAKSVGYDINLFEKEIIKHALSYYCFAHKLKFDIVVSFDLGGKYTFKDGEKQDKDLQLFLKNLDDDRINNILLRETAKFVLNHPNFYPKILATVHGFSPNDYKNNIRNILYIEKEYKIKFWGFALGGIANYKIVDDSWYSDIESNHKSEVVVARACKFTKDIVGDRPIHALGCGGYNNILLNYFNGATSFDAASPNRRVGDGCKESAEVVFNPRHFRKSEIAFSKYFVGGINDDGTLRTEPCDYVNLNEVPNDMSLCGCKACQIAKNLYQIKKLYSMKQQDDEAFYFSRQLMGCHAVLQHRKLCEIIAKYDTVDQFCEAYPSSLNMELKRICNEI